MKEINLSEVRFADWQTAEGNKTIVTIGMIVGTRMKEKGMIKREFSRRSKVQGVQVARKDLRKINFVWPTIISSLLTTEVWQGLAQGNNARKDRTAWNQIQEAKQRRNFKGFTSIAWETETEIVTVG